MADVLELKRFCEIDLDDLFFDSLKADYIGFENWFKRKNNESAYVFEDEGKIQGFLYLKIEVGAVTDTVPELKDGSRLKIGTMKINPHGTRLGERFIKKAFDHAIINGVEEIYVTAFPKQDILIDLFKKYGFVEHGIKQTASGEELVLLKSLHIIKNDILFDYPKVRIKNANKYLLSIYPEYHTRLFPDSILKNESFNIIEDVSHTNSIHKIYICKMNVSRLRKGDILVIYRTSDGQGKAWYRSVATSICVVEERKSKQDFIDINDFINYCKSYSVFSEEELEDLYRSNKMLYVIKMTYNIAMRRRLTRGRLIENVGISEKAYPGFLPLNDNQFELIMRTGDVDESLVID